jgi:hypothetical protein
MPPGDRMTVAQRSPFALPRPSPCRGTRTAAMRNQGATAGQTPETTRHSLKERPRRKLQESSNLSWRRESQCRRDAMNRNWPERWKVSSSAARGMVGVRGFEPPTSWSQSSVPRRRGPLASLLMEINRYDWTSVACDLAACRPSLRAPASPNAERGSWPALC